MGSTNQSNTTEFSYITSINRTYDAYQRYYLLGMLPYLQQRNIHSRQYPSSNMVGRLYRKLIAPIMPVRPSLPSSFCSHDHDHVGRYVLMVRGKLTRFAIDAHDHRDISSPEILEWSDIYFKSNKWQGHDYPAKVFPIVNGNGRLSLPTIEYLKSLRHQEKTHDLTFIARIWGGREHNIRLFEHVAKVKCNKNVLAHFTQWDRRQSGTPKLHARLQKAGVEWSYDEMPHRELSSLLGRSKIVVLRLGKHLCIPWSMVDLLCMGACIVLDSDPRPAWPVRLLSGVNYLDLGISRQLGDSYGSEEEYAAIPAKIEELLSNDQLREQISAHNQSYFDTYAAPVNVAEYIFSTIAREFSLNIDNR